MLRLATAHTVPPAELGVQYVDEKEVSGCKATWRPSAFMRMAMYLVELQDLKKQIVYMHPDSTSYM